MQKVDTKNNCFANFTLFFAHYSIISGRKLRFFFNFRPLITLLPVEVIYKVNYQCEVKNATITGSSSNDLTFRTI